MLNQAQIYVNNMGTFSLCLGFYLLSFEETCAGFSVSTQHPFFSVTHTHTHTSALINVFNNSLLKDPA